MQQMVVTRRNKCIIITIILLLVVSGSRCNQTNVSPTLINGNIEPAKLAYTVQLGMNSKIQMLDLYSSRSICIAQVDGQARMLNWSPDGEYLAWIAYKYPTRQSSLWIMKPGSGEVATQVVTPTKNLLTYQWSPDSSMLFVLEANSDPGDGKILNFYVLSVTTWQRMSVWFMSLPFHAFIDFAISPDWQYMAYLQDDHSTLTVRDRCGQTWDIFDLPAGAHGFNSLAWSPNSQWLAFSVPSADYEQANVFISHFNGEQLQQLTSLIGIRGNLFWSHSGDYLAFTLLDSNDGNQLCYICIGDSKTSPDCLKSIWTGGKMQWLSDDELILATNKINGQWDIYRILLTDRTFLSLTQDDKVESDLALWIIDYCTLDKTGLTVAEMKSITELLAARLP